MINCLNKHFSCRDVWTLLFFILPSTVLLMLGSTTANAQNRLQAGVLACTGEGGWGQVVASTKQFKCTFAPSGSTMRGEYAGTIRKFGLDVGRTGSTSIMWLVFGPSNKIGDDFLPGSLQGSYSGVGAEATVGMGLGANALVGGGPDSFALQPISVQVQTGLSVAAGVQILELRYVGPLNPE